MVVLSNVLTAAVGQIQLYLLFVLVADKLNTHSNIIKANKLLMKMLQMSQPFDKWGIIQKNGKWNFIQFIHDNIKLLFFALEAVIWRVFGFCVAAARFWKAQARKSHLGKGSLLLFSLLIWYWWSLKRANGQKEDHEYKKN